jgi:hypothetical protein
MKKFVYIVVLVVPFLQACSGSSSMTSAPVTPQAVASTDCGAFESVKDVVRTCYDNAAPDVSCDSMRDVAVLAGLQIDLKPSQQVAVAELCGRSCDARKQGVSWYEMNQQLQCTEGI